MWKALGMMLVSLLALGCGSSSGSACDKVVKGYQDYASKASACGVNIPLGGFDAASCEAAFKSRRLHRCGQVALRGLRDVSQQPSRMHPREHQPVHDRRPPVHREAEHALARLPVSP